MSSWPAVTRAAPSATTALATPRGSTPPWAQGSGRADPVGKPARSAWGWLQVAFGVLVLALVVWRVGTGPFRDGMALVTARSLLAATGIAVVTTVCCAWRWSLVARGLGVAVPLRVGVLAYYRSQFLNTTLPGGVVGDVHRAVRHGREVGDLGMSSRAVAWERSAGQFVQLLLTGLVLLVLPSPVRSAMPVVAGVAVAAVAGVLVLERTVPAAGSSRWARARRAAAGDLRRGLLSRRAWPGILVASAIVVAGHTATFLIAARTAGSSAPSLALAPLALLILLAMGIPANIGGWGPREGVAAWLFALAGLGSTLGVTTAVIYGVMVLVASLPGAAVLVVGWLLGGRRGSPQPATGEGAALCSALGTQAHG
jgi:glycosyltransferase 2 family protein